MKKKKTTDLENYEKEYLSRLKHEKKTKQVKQKKSAVKKTVKKVSKKPTRSKTKKPRKSAKVEPSKYDEDDTGIVLIDDDLEIDEKAELEERKAYLEEARSQESSD